MTMNIHFQGQSDIYRALNARQRGNNGGTNTHFIPIPKKVSAPYHGLKTGAHTLPTSPQPRKLFQK